MELLFELKLQCKKKYEKLLLNATMEILQIEGIQYKNCTIEKIRGIILENDIEDNSLNYCIFKVDGICSVKMSFSNKVEETIIF
jgi:hypothetical protein